MAGCGHATATVDPTASVDPIASVDPTATVDPFVGTWKPQGKEGDWGYLVIAKSGNDYHVSPVSTFTGEPLTMGTLVLTRQGDQLSGNAPDPGGGPVTVVLSPASDRITYTVDKDPTVLTHDSAATSLPTATASP